MIAVFYYHYVIDIKRFIMPKLRVKLRPAVILWVGA